MRGAARFAGMALLGALLTTATGCAGDPNAAKLAAYERGKQLAADSKFSEAIIEYRRALAYDAGFVEARVRLADAYLAVGEGLGALGEFVRIADLTPNDAQAQVRAGSALLIARKFEDAGSRAEKALAIEPGHVKALVLLGNSLAGMQDFDRAAHQFEEAIRAHPDDSLAYASLGYLEIARGDLKRAEVAFLSAVEKSSSSTETLQALGDFYWAAGRRQDAEAGYRKVLSRDPANLRSNQRLALLLMMSGRVAEAKPYVAKVAEIGTGSDRLALADYYLMIGNTAAAVELMEKYAESDEGSIEADLRLASLEITNGKVPQALERLKRVFKRRPGSPRGLTMQAQAVLAQGHIDEALVIARQAVNADTGSAEGYLTLGRIYRAQNNLADATRAYEDAARLSPRSTTAVIELARLRLLTGTAGAVKFADQAVQNDPDNPLARLVLAQALQRNGDLRNAEKELKRLEQLTPNAAPVHVQKGALYMAQHDAPSAARSFEKALQLDPRSTDALAGLVATDVVLNRLPSAKARVDARLASTPKDPKVLQLAARLYVQTGDTKLAEKALRDLIQVEPASLDAYNLLGQLLVREKRVAEAQAEFEALAARQPKDVGARTALGVIHTLRGKEPEARVAYEAALAIDPTAVIAANNLAWLLAQQPATLDRAMQLAQTARAQQPDRAEINDTLGWIYVKKNFPALALPLLRAALADDPNNPYYHFHMGMALAATKDTAQARVHLNRALAVSQNFEGADQARRTLSTLR